MNPKYAGVGGMYFSDFKTERPSATSRYVIGISVYPQKGIQNHIYNLAACLPIGGYRLQALLSPVLVGNHGTITTFIE